MMFFRAAACLVAAALCLPSPPAIAAEAVVSDSVRLILDALAAARPDVEGIRARREILSREAPDSGDPRGTAEFLLQQAAAAAELGQTGLELRLRRRALDVARGTEMEIRALADLTNRERQVGNYAASDALRREMLDKGRAAGPLINAWGSLAIQAARGGRTDEAEEAFRRAEASHAIAMSNRGAQTWFRDQYRALLEYFRGGLLLVRGRVRESENAYRQALNAVTASLQIAERRRAVLGSTSPTPLSVHQLYDNIEGGLIDCLVDQGRFGEAEVMLRQRIRRQLARVGGTSPEVAGSAQIFADLVAAQSRFGEAEALSGAVLDIYGKIGVEPSSRSYMVAVMSRATALFGLGEFARVVQVIDQWPDVESRAAVRNADYVISAVRNGETNRALPAARGLLRRVESRFGADHIRTGEARGALAMVQAALGNRTEALAMFREALQIILAARAKSQSTQDEAIARLRFEAIGEDYLSLLWSMKGGAAPGLTPAQIDEESFSVADALLSGSVQRAVASSAARNAADPALADLTRREQELGREISTLAELVANMDAAPPAQQLPKVMADMRARIAAAGAEQQRLLDEMTRRFPSYAQLISPRPVTGGEFAKQLGSTEAALVVYTGQRQHFVWSVDAGGIRSFRAVDAGLNDILADIQPIRRSIDPYANGLRDVPPFPLDRAWAVYQKYFKASLEAVPGARSLVVAANAPFASLPISLLPLAATDLPPDDTVAYREYRKVPWLIERYAISLTPSANALVLLRTAAARPAATQPFVGFGDPIFDKAQLTAQAAVPDLSVRGGARALVRGVAARTRGVDRDEYRSLARLPDTAEEIQAVAKALNAGADSVFLQARANEKELKSRDLRSTRVVFFATHGLVPGELTGLNQPALALSAPDVAGVEGDGLLTQEEVLGLSLGADWVVLSACNTASADGRGGEALSGLGRAFFYAGARSLLLSHWPVETVSARLLTTGIFAGDNGKQSKAEAVRAAMRTLIESGEAKGPDNKPAYAYAHPLFWAPFTVVGDAR